MYLWTVIAIKVRSVMSYALLKARTIRLLGFDHKTKEIDEDKGRNHFLTMFQYLTKLPDATTHEPVLEFTRLIGNELVGKCLGVSTQSKALVTTTPELCTHPNSSMVRRGNAPQLIEGKRIQSKWWTCKDCHTRWERIPMPNREDRAPEDHDPLVFGKHVGKTYAEVFQRHPSYVKWVVTTAQEADDPQPDLVRFALYCLNRSNLEDQEAQEAREVAAAPDYPMEWDMTEQEAAQLAYQQLHHLQHPRVPEGEDPDL